MYIRLNLQPLLSFAMLAACSPMAYTPSPMVVRAPTAVRAIAPVMETLDDLKALAPKLNPVVGYYNPCASAAPQTGCGCDASQRV